MANYYAHTRTNYFHVTDETRYQVLYKLLGTYDEEIQDFSKKDTDGTILHAFGANSDIFCRTPDDDEPDDSMTYFLQELRKILPNDEVFAIESIGHEKLCYLNAIVILVTPTEIRHINLDDEINTQAAIMTNGTVSNIKIQF